MLADQIGFLRDGKIVASGTPDEMKRMAGADKLILLFNNQQDTEKALELLESYSPVKKEDCEISIDLTEEITTTLNVLNALTIEKIELKTFKMITPTIDDVL